MKEKIISFINYKTAAIVYSISFLLMIFMSFFNLHSGMIVLNFVILIFNIFLTCRRRDKGFVFLVMFYLALYVFILSRPTIAIVEGIDWMYFKHYTINVAQLIIFFVIVFLQIGFFIGNKKSIKNNTMENTDLMVGKAKKIIVSILLVTILCDFINQLSILISNYGNYTNIYLGLGSGIPVIRNIGELCTYFVIFYLCTIPSKKNTLIILFLFVLCGIPGFILGGRNAIIIKVLFCITYILLREFVLHENWINKRIIIIGCIIIPVGLCVLGAMNYIRDGDKVKSFSPTYLICDFLYKQGTSYDTLCQTIEYREKLRDDNYVNYTFGEFIDFATRNTISNKILGTEHLENGNGIVNATKSNNLAHRISYLVLGGTYFSGHGRGTTYMSEIYLDFGYLGIILFNIAIGFFFSRILYLFKQSFVTRYLVLSVLLYIFIIPRLSFCSMFSFLINYYFWIFVVITLIVLRLCHNKKVVYTHV